jgi:hypothetical protein
VDYSNKQGRGSKGREQKERLSWKPPVNGFLYIFLWLQKHLSMWTHVYKDVLKRTGERQGQKGEWVGRGVGVGGYGGLLV